MLPSPFARVRKPCPVGAQEPLSFARFSSSSFSSSTLLLGLAEWGNNKRAAIHQDDTGRPGPLFSRTQHAHTRTSPAPIHIARRISHWKKSGPRTTFYFYFHFYFPSHTAFFSFSFLFSASTAPVTNKRTGGTSFKSAK